MDRSTVDSIISKNLNDYIDDDRLRETCQAVAEALNSGDAAVSQDEFEKIFQVSSLVVKALSKPIVYAAIESLHEINDSLLSH